MSKKHILFVDDEPNVLQGLTRMLRPLRHEWEIVTAESGNEALSILAESSFDVIVTDMRMPGMDGAQLLNEVMKRYPQIVRIVLSGQSDQESILRSVGPTHQYLSKPCDAETLKATVDRACNLRDVLASATLRRLASQMQSLPSLPSIYMEVLKEVRSPEPAIEKIGRLISRDAAMTAKILQLVNSAFFGFYSHITDPCRAVTILGLDKIRSLVLTIHIFTQFNQAQLTRFNLDALWHHNLYVGQCAKEISVQQNAGKATIEESFMAGMLHDTGKLILMANLPDDYQKALATAKQKSITENQAEYEVFGTSHAEIGAYLLGLWGLPTPIVEAIAFHHRPTACTNQNFSPLTTVYAADMLVREAQNEKCEAETNLDTDYLNQLGLVDKVPAWQVLCRETVSKEHHE